MKNTNRAIKEYSEAVKQAKKSAIKTGRLSPLVNGNTGEVDRFIEY